MNVEKWMTFNAARSMNICIITTSILTTGKGRGCYKKSYLKDNAKCTSLISIFCWFGGLWGTATIPFSNLNLSRYATRHSKDINYQSWSIVGAVRSWCVKVPNGRHRKTKQKVGGIVTDPTSLLPRDMLIRSTNMATTTGSMEEKFNIFFTANLCR